MDCGTWRQHGRAQPPCHLGRDERTRRGRRHQPGQPAAGIAGILEAEDGIKYLKNLQSLRLKRLLHCSTVFYDFSRESSHASEADNLAASPIRAHFNPARLR